MELLDRGLPRRGENYCHSPFRTGNATDRATYRLQTPQTADLLNPKGHRHCEERRRHNPGRGRSA